MGRFKWAAIALLIALPMLLLADALWPGHVLADAGVETKAPWQDTVTQAERALPQVNEDTFRENLVYRRFLHETLGEGEIPLWTPYMYGGSPFLALSHTEVLYPPNWVASQIDPDLAYGLMIALHLALAGVGMFLLLADLGLGGIPLLVGAIVFMLNGMFATRHGHPQYVVTGAWLPWLLLGVNWLTSRRWARGALLVAFGTAMMVLAGHPSIYVYSYYLVGLWWVLRLLRGDASWKERGALTGLFVAAFAIGVGLASTQLLATMELSEFSARASRSKRALTWRLSHWSHLLRLVFPHVTGTRLDGSYWSISFTHQWAGTLYVGVPTLILGAIGAVRGRPWARWLGGATVLVILILFVPAVYGIAWEILPGLRFSRADRLSIVFFATMAMLAACGTEVVLDRAATAARPPGRVLLRTALPWTLPLLVAAVVAVVGIPVLAEARHRIDAIDPSISHLWDQVLRGSAFWLATVAWLVAARAGWAHRRVLGGAILALLLLDLGLHARHFVVVRDADRVLRTTPAIEFLQQAEGPFRIAKFGGWRDSWDNAVFPANTPMAYGIEDLHGFGPLHMRDLDRLLAQADPGRRNNPWHLGPLESHAALGSPVLDMLGVRYVLAITPLEPTSLERVFEGGVLIYENPDVLPRAWVVPSWRTIRNARQAARQIASGALDPRVAAAVATEVAPPESDETGGPAQVEFLGRDLQTVRFRKTGPGAGLLVHSEAWYPGWTATVDGRTRPVVRTNSVLQGVPVGPGEHEVVFEYRPTWLRPGAVLTGVAGAGLLTLVGLALWRRREERAPRSLGEGA